MNNNEDLKKIALNYFQMFSDKNLKGLKKLLDDDIVLIDWENQVKGLENVILQFENIFKKFNSIEIINKTIVAENLNISAEIEITFDKKISIYVTDWLKFSKNLKIKSISAYKR